MSKETEDRPAVVHYRKKYSRKDRKRMVPLKYKDHPPHPRRRLLAYLLVAVVAFCLLHFGMHVG